MGLQKNIDAIVERKTAVAPNETIGLTGGSLQQTAEELQAEINDATADGVVAGQNLLAYYKLARDN